MIQGIIRTYHMQGEGHKDKASFTLIAVLIPQALAS